MTPYELKRRVEATGSYFFTKKAMKFFGDTMKNFGCQSHGDYWELTRKHPVPHLGCRSTFFRKSDFSRVYTPKETNHEKA